MRAGKSRTSRIISGPSSTQIPRTEGGNRKKQPVIDVLTVEHGADVAAKDG